MGKLIIYLLECSVVLGILYTLYLVALSKETFFSLNRFFLLAILAFSFVVPCLRFDISASEHGMMSAPVKGLNRVRLSYYDALAAWPNETLRSSPSVPMVDDPSATEAENTPPWPLVALFAVYSLGVLAVIVRLVWLYHGIHKLRRSGKPVMIGGLTVVRVSQPIAPFSFFRSVFVPEAMVQGTDFDQILAHEKTHIQEGHSLDLLFVQLLAAALWFNPVVWRLIKSLKTTHEYIADKKMIDQGYSFVTYQALLLRQLVSNHSYGLVHYFNLSFTKKRIIMMNAKKSGWVGRAKVALALSAVVLVSLVLVQCNATIEEQVLRESQASAAAENNKDVDLPVLPMSAFRFEGDLSQALLLTIADGIVTINGKVIAADAIATALKQKPAEHAVVIARIDRNQPMSLVRQVQGAFREAQRLKFLYIGQTAVGERVEMPILLPPFPGDASAANPAIDDTYARENDIALLKLDLGDATEATLQQTVYDFVGDQVAAQRSNYVVSARVDDDDTYDAYLTNLFAIKEAFYQRYDERAQAMYGKRFWEISADRATNEQHQAMYDVVRKGVPMNISIAEN